MTWLVYIFWQVNQFNIYIGVYGYRNVTNVIKKITLSLHFEATFLQQKSEQSKSSIHKCQVMSGTHSGTQNFM